MSIMHDYRYDLRIEGADEQLLSQFAIAFEKTVLSECMSQDPNEPELFSTEVEETTGAFYDDTIEQALHDLAVQFPTLKLHFEAEDMDDRGMGFTLKFQGDLYQRADVIQILTEFNPPVPFENRQEVLRVEHERAIEVDKLTDTIFKNTDYDLLYAQKQALLKSIETGVTPPKEAMEGLVNFLDNMGDLGEALGRFQYDGIEPPFPMQADYVKKEYAFEQKPASAKDKVMSLYEQMQAANSEDQDVYFTAKNLAYLARCVETDEEIPLDTLYQLAARLWDLGGMQPLLNEERLDAVRFLLEEGISIEVDGKTICLEREKMPAFLLSCSEDTFLYVVENTAYFNQEKYENELGPDTEEILASGLKKDITEFQKAEKKQKKSVPLADKIADAEQRKQKPTTSKSPEKENEI